MGQGASLYRIGKSDIKKMIDHAAEFDLLAYQKEYASFEKSFEGLRFILSKDRSGEEDELIHQIFYPESHAGEAVDFEELDIDDIPENFDWSSDAIYYNEPPEVKVIAGFLNAISDEEFTLLFDANELNQNDVYPGNVWNNETGDNTAFNAKYITHEFKRLKAFYANAHAAGDYVIAMVG